ncbi:hypothetical protein [Flavobacterium sp.]|uniref:FEKKY domain-containing protein n=1 Tax=Flavobacterium sp. TaxID=239 RepID=UPI00374D2460
MRKILFLIFILLLGCKSTENPLSGQYKEDALHDIKVDSVKTFTYGLPFISPIDTERKIQEARKYKRDSIYKKYGLYIQNQGCVIGDKKMDKAIKEYHNITDVYLDNRNGKGWKEKMNKEVDNIDGN